MATVINNPPDGGVDNTGSNAALILGIIIAAIIIAALFLYGLPGARRSSTNITVPDKINVDVNPGQQGQ